VSSQLWREPSAAEDGADQVTAGELFRDREFRLYLIGQTTSGVGSALSSVALIFAVLSISRSASSLGLVLLASRLPGVVLSMAGGVIADRWPRQRVAATADLARTVLQACTGALLLSGNATILALVLLQTLAGGANVIFGPAANALAAGVAPRGQLRRANSLVGTSAAVAQTAGLALSGALVAIACPGASFLIDSATFAVSSLCLTLVRTRAVPVRGGRGMLRELREGWDAATARGWVVVYAVHLTVINVLTLCPLFVLGPVIAERLGGAPAWSAIALGYAVGNIAAAQLTFRWAPRRPVLAAVTTSTALAPLLALLGLAAPIWLIAPAAFLAGLQSTLYNTLINSTLQSNLPDELLGRVGVVARIGSTMLVPVGMGVAGVLATNIGASTVLTAAAVIVVAAAAAAACCRAGYAQLGLNRVPVA
jgi:Major Facilitator Superfamily